MIRAGRGCGKGVWRLVLTVSVLLVSPVMQAQEAFQVTLNQDGETIADMRPVYLQFRAQALPDISPREVARRYQRLFEQSDEPEVRIDALNRLSNLQSLAEEDLHFSPDQEQAVYHEALGSYDEILARGAFQGRLDELLYQMAKAHAFVGQGQQSTARLKQLIGLYPDSPLIPEARFRVAEAAFTAGQFHEAEVLYREVLNEAVVSAPRAEQTLNDKARYMLGWAQYKQGAYRRAGESFLSVLDRQAQQTLGFTAIPATSLEMIDDTFRIIAIMAAKGGGIRIVDEWLAEGGGRSYVDLLYDRLADYYASTGHYLDAVAVADGFIERYPSHPGVPSFLAQIVDVHLLAGDELRALQAREHYVTAYGADHRYQRLSESDQQRWQGFSRMVADHYYSDASRQSQASGRQTSPQVQRDYRKAAGYYAALAERIDAPGEVLRLAGDAALQGDDRPSANAYYQRAAYQSGPYQAAADAGWASLTLQREGLESKNEDRTVGAGGRLLITDLSGYADSTEKFAAAFPQDERLAKLHADVANRLFQAGDYGEADRFAQAAIALGQADVTTRYGSWLVSADAQLALRHYSAAENGWRQALTLAGQVVPAVAPEEQQRLVRQLAVSIYRQGEAAESAGAIDQAIAHYQRIESVAPGSDIAIKGRFDAANTLLQSQRWQSAINELHRFRNDYPNNTLTAQVSEKLVYAYQSSGQPVRAADELVGRASLNNQVRLRAAELYHAGGAMARRNTLYHAVLSTSGQASTAADHIQQQRIRHRLLQSEEASETLRADLVLRELGSDWHSAETLAWAAESAMSLGIGEAERFEAIRLTHPLARSLAEKQHAMDAAKQYFNQVAELTDGELYSESLFRRAELYRVMAADLMASSRPDGLSDLEAMQYDMLLEEQAFPFEELAIELHEQNHRQLERQYFDRWVQRSLDTLADLHPGRYARDLQWMSWGPDHGKGEDDA